MARETLEMVLPRGSARRRWRQLARIIELAGEINADMPHYVASKVVDELIKFG